MTENRSVFTWAQAGEERTGMGIVGPGWDMFLSLLCGRYLGVLVKNHHTVHLKLLHFILCKLQWTLDKALIDSFVFLLISMIGNTPTE